MAWPDLVVSAACHRPRLWVKWFGSWPMPTHFSPRRSRPHWWTIQETLSRVWLPLASARGTGGKSPYGYAGTTLISMLKVRRLAIGHQSAG